MSRRGGLLLLVAACCLSSFTGGEEKGYEYPPYDGWYNNLHNPAYGAADTQLLRRVAPAYKDGVYEPSGHRRPNPIDISMNVFNGSTGETSLRDATAFLVFFGQQVVEEILDAQRPGCPPEYMNIRIPKGHPQYDPEGKDNQYMPFLRSRYDQRTGYSPNVPRQQLNEITPWLDGGLVYGPNKAWADALRAYEGGLLAAANDSDAAEGYFPAYNDLRLPMANPPPPRDHTLKPIRRFFKLGNPRGNENPFLLTFGILWFRYHNFRARQLAHAHPDWNDERLFNEARKWVIAVYQKVVIEDWLPAWINTKLPVYKGYSPTTDPAIAHVFQSAAMRFGHTMVVPGVFRRNKKCDVRQTSKITGSEGHKALRTCNTYWNPQESVQEQDIDELLLGMASQHAEREDMIITPDLRGDVFGPLEFSRRDLMAINIQRARDHGVPDYNAVREAYGLPRRTSWDEFRVTATRPADLIDRFRSLYNDSVEDVDLWPAGMLETDRGPGELFKTIILDQFRRIRDSDRFWFENKQNGLFTDEEIAEIKKVRINDIITSVTNITENDIQSNPFFYKRGDPCFNKMPKNLKAEDMEACTPKKTFDYFSGSEVSYALSIVGILSTFFIAVAVLKVMAKLHDRQVAKERSSGRVVSPRPRKSTTPSGTAFAATEFMGREEGERSVVVRFEERSKTIVVADEKDGKALRVLDFNLLLNTGTNRLDIVLSADRDYSILVLRIPMEYDLILRFENMRARDDFFEELKRFAEEGGIKCNPPMPMSEKMICNSMRTKAVRAQQLEQFFKSTFNMAFHYDDSSEPPRDAISPFLEITKVEFADALALKPHSMFVENMFEFADKDNNGYLSFSEFLSMIVVFSKGTAEEKAKMMFEMYDVTRRGSLTQDEFKTMLVSLMDLANEKVEEAKINEMIDTILSDIGLSDKSAITFSDFKMILKDYEEELNYTSLSFSGAGVDMPRPQPVRAAAPTRARRTFHTYRSERDQQTASHRFSQPQEIQTINTQLPASPLSQRWLELIRFVQNYRLQIFWATLYTLVCIGIFAERAYYYSTEREHGGLRRIAGYGVTVTRGAASGMMFTFSCLLVTMCRNLITFLRETFLHRYVPFDSAISMHKYISCLALFFTLMHIVGHCINFYHISTQTADDLTCLFRNFFHATDELPKFHYWMWGTLTGVTGVLLTVLIFVMYVFATQYARRHAFKAFWVTHHLHVLLWVLMVLHGAGRLVQPAFFHYFFLGPVILFTLDKLVSVSRKKVEIAVLGAELLPSDVLCLQIKRPANFHYKSGQWVRIACLPLGTNEYHPFTLSSAPHEENLSLHIRAVGPWTYNLRRKYDVPGGKISALPKVYLDGPYGEGHQDWYRYDVAILVGGGIGVTPFASILKDIAHRSKNGEKLICKKVYFLWITRTQKQFEWMTDIIREVEENDLQDLVSVHIFITQFKEKFDVRTTMLYICERYFQKISSRSLFTGLRSITHFGRPDFTNFFEILQTEHPDVNVFGVFSCGPPPMTAGVEKACSTVNKYITDTLFVHHYENF